MKRPGSWRWIGIGALALVAISALLLLRGSQILELRGSQILEEPEPPFVEMPDPDLLLEQLEALGYIAPVTSDPSPELTRVVHYDEDLASPGVNVYCSVLSKEVHFFDMRGRELHSLSLPRGGPGQDCLLELDGAGGFLVITAPSIMRLDWDSNVIWERSDWYHHDLFVGPDRRIFTLSEQAGRRTYRDQRMNVRDHALVELSADGEVLDRNLISELFWDLIPDKAGDGFIRFARTSDEAVVDALHPNSVQVIDRDIGPAKAGDILLGLRNINTIAILAADRDVPVWSWGPDELDHPHHPTLLPNGRVLVFDNGMHRGYSRLLEVDPRTDEIVWEYKADPPSEFFSQVRGSVQPLPNGNLLVTESTKGHVFEITRDGQKVWEFWNPDIWPPTGDRRQLYRMIRLTPEEWESLQPEGWESP